MEEHEKLLSSPKKIKQNNDIERFGVNLDRLPNNGSMEDFFDSESTVSKNDEIINEKELKSKKKEKNLGNDGSDSEKESTPLLGSVGYSLSSDGDNLRDNNKAKEDTPHKGGFSSFVGEKFDKAKKAIEHKDDDSKDKDDNKKTGEETSHNGGSPSFMDRISAKKKEIGDKVDGVKKDIGNKVNDLKIDIEEKVDDVKISIDNDVDDAKKVVDDAKKVVDDAKKVVDDTKKVVEKKIDSTKKVIEENVDGITSIVGSTLDDAKKAIEENVHGIEIKIHDTVEGIEDTVSVLSNVGNLIKLCGSQTTSRVISCCTTICGICTCMITGLMSCASIGIMIGSYYYYLKK